MHPVAHSGVVGRISLFWWLQRLRRGLSAMRIQKPILWVEHPWALPAVGRLGEVLSVYHIIDEYQGYTGLTPAQRNRLAARERTLLQRVDLSIAVSEELRRTKESDGRPIPVVPNAVDFEAYTEVTRTGTTPEDLRGLAGPIVGYCGLIGARLDLERIERAVRSRSGYQFVFVGKTDPRRCRATLARLAALPNVHFLGEKDGSQVPEYVARFDVGLMPYKSNLETRSVSPMKLYQYLAAGIPVVSTDIPATTALCRLVRVVRSTDNLASVVDAALQEDGESGRRARRAFAARNTWDHRVASILQILETALAEKRREPKGVEPRTLGTRS